MAKRTISYTGDLVSLNHYKSLSWQKLKKKLDIVKFQFNALIMRSRMPKFLFIEVRVSHNTRLDMDNVVGMIKPFVDCLRHCNVIEDDNKRYFDYLSIQYNPDLDKGILNFEITGEIRTKKKRGN